MVVVDVVSQHVHLAEDALLSLNQLLDLAFKGVHFICNVIHFLGVVAQEMHELWIRVVVSVIPAAFQTCEQCIQYRIV